MTVSLLNTIETLQAKLAVAKDSLAFVSKHLPGDMLERVTSCTLGDAEAAVVVECQSGDLARLIAIFPSRADQQYLPSRDGTPVSRAEALTLRHPFAAAPVHAAWQRESAVRGSAVCWRSEVDGLAVVVEAQGAAVKEAQTVLWTGCQRRSQVDAVSYIIYERPLPALTVAEGPSPEVMPATLKEVVSYLNAFLARERPMRRGAAPAEVLGWLATKQFGLRVNVTVYQPPRPTSDPTTRYTVSIADARGRHWHEISQVELLAKDSSLDDAMWYDLVER